MSTYQLFRVVAAAVIHDGNGKFLMAQRHAKDENQPGRWAIPAGHLEIDGSLNEPKPDALEENLRREALEEVGVEIEIERYLDSHYWAGADYRKLTVVFLCQIKSGEPKALDETQAVAWLTLDEIKGLDLAPQVLRLVEKAQRVLAE
ncbi:MAG: NUDIX domain-containing protein [Patescibacteria group bacterium]|jgi:8-oxo-dGTP pyrophosphatase MutT (NUDIX family)